MTNIEQRPQEAPRTTTLPKPDNGGSRGTGQCNSSRQVVGC